MRHENGLMRRPSRPTRSWKINPIASSAGWQPWFGRPRVDIGVDVDDHRFVRSQRLPQCRRDLRRLLHPNAAQAEHTRYIGEVGGSEPYQLAHVARCVALLTLDVRPALAEA